MSFSDYKISQEIIAEDYPFYALIMAAMRQADHVNIKKLKKAFPDVYYEMSKRNTLPGNKYNLEKNGV